MADMVIIGAGAAGLFCAATLGQLGKSVLVLDHANKVGKKILMSGGGFCNFTNLDVEPQHYLSQNPHFVRSALAQFRPDDFLAMIKKHRIAYHEKTHGQLFCTHSAKDIVHMLLAECQVSVQYGGQVDIRLNTAIHAVQKNANGGFDVQIYKKSKEASPIKTIHAPKLIIATGGLSIPTMGATGFGYQLGQDFGHDVIATRPSLVPFTLTDDVGTLIKAHAGVSLDVIAYNTRQAFHLPMLLTHRGLSGPAMLQISNYWQESETITVNLVPELDLPAFFLTQKLTHPKQRIRTLLTPFFAKKFLLDLQRYFWQDISDKPLADISDKRLKALGQMLNAWQIKPAGTEGYRVAEVTMGGIDTKAISSKTMQSRLVPDLYFIGEVLDVTGWLGGYNFHWAWASAYACAMGIAQS